jgi:hypothetical protein
VTVADIVAVITGTTIIGRPPQVVFDCLADPRHEPAYNPVVVSAAKLTREPIGPRTRAIIDEVLVTVDTVARAAVLRIIWQGGSNTELVMGSTETGGRFRATDEDSVDLVRWLMAIRRHPPPRVALAGTGSGQTCRSCLSRRCRQLVGPSRRGPTDSARALERHARGFFRHRTAALVGTDTDQCNRTAPYRLAGPV